MSGNTNNSPMLKAAGLWAKTSVNGGQYLTGRLGGVKVLVMENHDRQSDDDPSHHLFFLEPPDRLQGGQERAQERPDGQGREKEPRTHQKPSQPRRSGFQPHRQPTPDHQAPLRRGEMPVPARDSYDDVPEWAR
jgi:hypothetical protein